MIRVAPAWVRVVGLPPTSPGHRRNRSFPPSAAVRPAHGKTPPPLCLPHTRWGYCVPVQEASGPQSGSDSDKRAPAKRRRTSSTSTEGGAQKVSASPSKTASPAQTMGQGAGQAGHKRPAPNSSEEDGAGGSSAKRKGAGGRTDTNQSKLSQFYVKQTSQSSLGDQGQGLPGSQPKPSQQVAASPQDESSLAMLKQAEEEVRRLRKQLEQEEVSRRDVESRVRGILPSAPPPPPGRMGEPKREPPQIPCNDSAPLHCRP